jgi:hypothetical protein
MLAHRQYAVVHTLLALLQRPLISHSNQPPTCPRQVYFLGQLAYNVALLTLLHIEHAQLVFFSNDQLLPVGRAIVSEHLMQLPVQVVS